MCTPLAGAILARLTRVNPIPPAASDVGSSVNVAIGGVGGSVPPGFNVNVCRFPTSWNPFPDGSV
jgi:hypothetical protein